jgi:hypothetical protein
MNAGKTTAAAALIRGLSAAGIATAGLKATGTGAFGDLHAYADAGAAFVADFTDDGLASTCRQPLVPDRRGARRPAGHAAAAGCEAAVVEIADGLLQPRPRRCCEARATRRASTERCSRRETRSRPSAGSARWSGSASASSR